jgi:hypothetical protein
VNEVGVWLMTKAGRRWSRRHFSPVDDEFFVFVDVDDFSTSLADIRQGPLDPKFDPSGGPPTGPAISPDSGPLRSP